MIYNQTFLNVHDNSGVRKVQCIKVLNKSKYAKIGQIIIVTSKKVLAKSRDKAKKKSNIKKGQVLTALVVNTKKGIRRKNGLDFKYTNNSVVILKDKVDPIGTRVTTPLAYELRNLGFFKIISMSPSVI